jgi:hypothetical protein
MKIKTAKLHAAAFFPPAVGHLGDLLPPAKSIFERFDMVKLPSGELQLTIVLKDDKTKREWIGIVPAATISFMTVDNE